MRKSVYLVIRVKLEGEGEAMDNAAGEVGNDCDYSVTMPADSGIRVAGTEVIGCVDECPIE